jgi:hypothetical protein
MVDLGPCKTPRKNIANVVEYKEDGQNWLLLLTLVALTLIILFSEMLKISKKRRNSNREFVNSRNEKLKTH